MASWTAATAIPSGSLITSAWVTNIVNMTNFLGAGGGSTLAKDLCFVRQTTSQSFTVSTATTNRVNWDTEDIDAANGHSTAVASYMGYTAVAAGKYSIQASIPFNTFGASTDTVTIRFFRATAGTGTPTEMNGARFIYAQQPTTFNCVTPSYLCTLGAGDVIDVRVSPSAGTVTTSASTANNIQPSWSIQWVGA